jgi:hypothetical protein
LIAVETIEGADLIAYVNGTKPIPEPAAARQALADESAAAAAKAKEESEAPIIHHTPARAPFIPPAPPMPAD